MGIRLARELVPGFARTVCPAVRIARAAGHVHTTQNMAGAGMARRRLGEHATAGDRTEPLTEGCLAQNRVASVLEIMQELDVEVMPVRSSVGGGEILGFIHRVALENAEAAAPGDATVADVWWLKAPRVPADVPLTRILEAPDRAHVYLVVDALDRPIGILRPDRVAWPYVRSKEP